MSLTFIKASSAMSSSSTDYSSKSTNSSYYYSLAQARDLLSHLGGLLHPSLSDDSNAEVLISLLSHDELDYYRLSPLILECLSNSESTSNLFIRSYSWQKDDLIALSGADDHCAALFRMYLLKVLNTSMQIELSCVEIWRYIACSEYSPDLLPLCQALASQFIRNEGIWNLSGALVRLMCTTYQLESDTIKAIEVILEDKNASLYDRPVNQTNNTTSIADFYASFPYPAWKAIDQFALGDANASCNSENNEAKYSSDIGKNKKILIAGCGTGQQAISYSLAHPDSTVFAIDISKNSLRIAKSLAEKCLAENISFECLDLQDLPAMGNYYDLIVCTGVLHHLESPLTGLRSLAAVKSPVGLINIGLYSLMGRSFLREAADVLASLDSELPWTTREGIVKARETLLRAVPSGKELSLLLLCEDFFSANGCRDLLFNPCVSNYTLEMVSDLLNQVNLEFISFEFSNESVLHAYRSLFPFDVFCNDLSCWSAFEKMYPRCFLGMYNFWCK